MKMICPHCGVTGSIADKFIGRKLKCPKCGQSFRVTEEDAVQTAGPAVSSSLPPKTSRTGTDRANAEQSEQSKKNASCPSCGNDFPEDELIELKGQLICAACRPTMLQKLGKEAVESDSGGLEAGIAGHYDFQIGEMLSEAWSKVKGSKGAIFSAFFIMNIISRLLHGICGGVLYVLNINGENYTGLFIAAQIGIQLIIMALTVLFTGGLMMMGVRRAEDETISSSMIFDGFANAKPLIIAAILQTIIIGIGFVLFVIPGSYFSIGYMLTYPLIIDPTFEAVCQIRRWVMRPSIMVSTARPCSLLPINGVLRLLDTT
ncbi:MAG: hypothetical protein ACL93V_08410 [Candidatus Electrothrix sp. YB6]